MGISQQNRTEFKIEWNTNRNRNISSSSVLTHKS